MLDPSEDVAFGTVYVIGFLTILIIIKAVYARIGLRVDIAG
jgi:hypothetical protein